MRAYLAEAFGTEFLVFAGRASAWASITKDYAVGLILPALAWIYFGKRDAVGGRAVNAVGLPIGLAWTADNRAGGAIMGAARNSARALGPVNVAGAMSQAWVYVVGTVIGGAAAAGAYRYALKD